MLQTVEQRHSITVRWVCIAAGRASSPSLLGWPVTGHTGLFCGECPPRQSTSSVLGQPNRELAASPVAEYPPPSNGVIAGSFDAPTSYSVGGKTCRPYTTILLVDTYSGVGFELLRVCPLLFVV